MTYKLIQECGLKTHDGAIHFPQGGVRTDVVSAENLEAFLAKASGQAEARIKELEEALWFYTQPKIINGQGSGWQENIYCSENKSIVDEQDFGFTAKKALGEKL